MFKVLEELPLADKYLEDITRQEIIRWHHDQRSTPYEANRRLALIKHMLQYALDVGYVKINVAHRIKKHKEKRHELKLSADILFNKIYPVAEPMLKRAIMFAFHLVQHENEIKNLQWRDFDLNNRIVKFRRSKTDKEIVINYSNNPVLMAFLNHLKSIKRELSPYIICHAGHHGWQPYASFRSMWHRALKTAKYKKGEFKFKEIRHLANTLLKDANISVEKRMAMTGHQSIQSNEVYTHNTGLETVEASAALSRFGPKGF